MLRFGMVGGGSGSFIGAVHRAAVQMQAEQARLIAGVFSSDPERSRAFGSSLGLDARRVYGTYEEMALVESGRAADDRLDFVSIVAPTHVHAPAAVAFLERGFHVVCEKPVAMTLADAEALHSAVTKAGKVFVLTHNYVGNAMVKLARQLVRERYLGSIRKVCVEYLQGWRSRFIESRDGGTPFELAAGSGCLAEIGSHAHNLLRYVTGLRIEEVCAEVTTVVEARPANDDVVVLMRFAGNARGILHCSQVALGEENNLNIRVYGDEASLEWYQESPDALVVKHYDRPAETRRRGNRYTGPAALRATRFPPGHPEGYLEAFANLYGDAFGAMRAHGEGRAVPHNLDVPGIVEGVEGMRFIEAALRSARTSGAWTAL